MDKANEVTLAVDGSAPSLSAASVGLRLAAALGDNPHAVFIAEPAEMQNPYAQAGSTTDSEAERHSTDEAVQFLEAYDQQVLDELASQADILAIPLSSEIEFGGVIPLLSRLVGASDLVTLGRSGRKHMDDEHALGANLEGLMNRVHKPLIIGGLHRPDSLDRLLLAYDGSDPAARALRWTLRIAGALGSKVGILAVNENARDDTEQADGWIVEALQAFPSGHNTPIAFTHHGQPGHEIAAAAAEHHADLILIGRPKGKLGGSLHSGLLDHLLRESPRPVLMA